MAIIRVIVKVTHRVPVLVVVPDDITLGEQMDLAMEQAPGQLRNDQPQCRVSYPEGTMTAVYAKRCQADGSPLA